MEDPNFGLEPLLRIGDLAPLGSANVNRSEWGSGASFGSFSPGGLSGGLLDFKEGHGVSETRQQRHENPHIWEGLSAGHVWKCSKTS